MDALDTVGGGTFATFTYDLSGNITQRTEPGATWDFVYDGDDQQRKVSYLGNTEIYFYGHDGQRYLAIEKDGAGALGRTRLFFGATEVWYDNRGRPTKSLVTVNLGQSVARIERVDQNRNLGYLYHSTLQHLVVALDNAGDVDAGFFYGPFGEVIEEVGAAGDYDRQFNDKHLDDLSALSYYGYRYYDSLSLAWTQADPMYRFSPDAAWAEPRKANLYVFSLQNPMRYVDPDGRTPNPAAQALLSPEESRAAAAAAGPAPTSVKIVSALMLAPLALPVLAQASTPILLGAAALSKNESDLGNVALAEAGGALLAKGVRGIASALRGGSRAAEEAVAGGTFRDAQGRLRNADGTFAKVAGPTAGKKVDSATRKRILARDRNADGSWTCATCGQKTANPSNIHTGHVKARSKGGDLSDGNLRCEGAACNLSQGAGDAPKPSRTCAERGGCGAPYGRTD